MPVIALAGAWAEPVSDRLRAHGFEPLICDDPAEYIEQLADQYAALVLVDNSDPNWRFWVTAAKRQSATRRIPVIVIVQHESDEPAAQLAGADAVLLAHDLDRHLIPLVHELARMPDLAVAQRLEDQCQDELPPRARLGIEKFNAGEYYQQHDLFEALWMEESGPVRDLYRAILQVGVAYYHMTRGNRRGAQRMLLRAVQWLAVLPDICQGVDVRQLREDVARVRTALQAEDMTAFDRSLLRPVKLVEL